MTLGDVPVLASAASVPSINRVLKLYPCQEIMWGYPEPSAVDCLPGRVETECFHFDVIETPGDRPGHVVLVD